MYTRFSENFRLVVLRFKGSSSLSVYTEVWFYPKGQGSMMLQRIYIHIYSIYITLWSLIFFKCRIYNTILRSSVIIQIFKVKIKNIYI